MAHEVEISKARKDAYDRYMGAKETAPKSKTKAWEFGFLGKLFFNRPFIAAFIGHFVKSEDLKRAERGARAAGADAALHTARDLGVSGIQYAKLAKEAKKTKVLSEEMKSRHSFLYGSIIGLIVGTALLATGTLAIGVAGSAIAAGIFAGIPLLGAIYDKTRDMIAGSHANSAGNRAYKDAINREPMAIEANPARARDQAAQLKAPEEKKVQFKDSVIARDEAKAKGR